MADRYWVGGNATWDATAGTKWSAISGGAGGASAPTNADDVYFDAASGAVTCTISGTRAARNIDCAGFTGTLAGTSTPALNVSGSLLLSAGMTLTYSGTTTFIGTGTLTSAGKTLGPVTINSAGITTTLGDALNIGTNTLTVTAGTLTTNGYNVTAGAISSSGSNSRTINLGSSAVTLNGSLTVVNFATNTNLTFNAGTSTISITSNTAAIVGGPQGSTGVTFYNVSFTSTTSSTLAGISIDSINTFNNLSFSAPSTAGYFPVSFDSPQTINGTLSTTGTAGNRRIWFRSETLGIAHTLTINATPSLTDADFCDIYVIGTAAPISGTRIGNMGGCRGITFDAPKSVYWVTAAGGNWQDNNWAPSSGGTANTDNFPLGQDTAVIENTGLNTSATVTMAGVLPYTGSVSMANRTNAMTLSLTAGQTIQGNWTNGSGTTLSGNQTLTFGGRGTNTIVSAGKSFSGDISVNCFGGTVELGDALSSSTSTLTVPNGKLDTKNYSVALRTIASSNANVREIVLGSSSVSLSITGTAVNFANTTNFTFDCGTSSISLISGSSVTFNGGGQTFFNVSFSNSNDGDVVKTITGQNVFNSLSISAAASFGVAELRLDENQTITGALTCAGASAVRRVFLSSNTLGTTRTITAGSISANDCDFRDITIAGAAAGASPTRAGDCGGNSGVTFPAAKTVYWNLAGTHNWWSAGWADTSGGTPAVANFPLAQDTAVFDNTGALGTVAAGTTPFHFGTLDASNRTSAGTLGVGRPRFYGDIKLGTGITIDSTSTTCVLSGRGTQTITSNGVQFGCPINITCPPTGIVQLADALSLGSTRTLTLTSGTFDAVTYNVTTGLVNFNSSTARTLKLGSGTWTLSGTGIVWNSSTTNLAFYKGTADILLSDTSTTSRTFAGAGLIYNKLTIGGATGTSTLTITGDNQFAELASTKTVAHTIALGTTTQTFGKWTVTGTVGNAVTLTGTGTSHILAGACTSGIDYLVMGSIGFAATSPGEFYAGANSTGTAGAPVYRTAKPADSTRYWVGGTGNWSSTTRWSTSSGGGSGASVPRSHDNVVFDSLSNATAYTATIDAVTGGARCKSLTISGPASGNVTLAGTAALIIHDDITLPATGLTRTYTGAITLSGSTTGKTVTTNGVALSSSLTINGIGCAWDLGSALNIGANNLTVANGSLDLVTYNLTVNGLSSTSGDRTIDFGSGTITINSVTFDLGTTETSRATLTIVAGTSQINVASSILDIYGNNQTFYNLSFTNTAPLSCAIYGQNTFNNLSFIGATLGSVRVFELGADQTVSGTLTFSAGTDATRRTFVRSDTIGVTRTITAAAFSGTDVDFRDITMAGAAAPVSGTRLGDCKGNSGITFDAGKTVYVRSTGSASWSSSTGWSATSGGTADITQFPLAQDTVVFPAATYPASGATITVNGNYNIGTIDMSLRTTNTVTLDTSVINPQIYGDWINGTGTTISGASTQPMTFAGRSSQTITSAGKAFTQRILISSPGGSVTLQDALSISNSSTSALAVENGTFDAATYNVTLSDSASGFSSNYATTRTVAVGSGTWALSGAGGWTTASTIGLTVTGTGTISMTSASAKTFNGGGAAYTNITLNQGGAGALTVAGNNTFGNITNTYKSTGATSISFGTATQRVSQWTAAGESGRRLTIQGTNASSPCTLIHTGGGDISVDYVIVNGVRAYPL